MSKPLDMELLEQLRMLPLGERIRELRLAKGFRYQKGLLAQLEKVTGNRPSAGWMSGVENGTFEPSAERLSELAEALELVGEEADLLVPSRHDGDKVPHAQQAYAAWQAVRLVLCDELLLDAKSSVDRARARAVRDRLRDVLAEDDAVWSASSRRVGMLSQFAALPESTRWMLVVEAAFMEPFLPHEPFTYKWDGARTRALTRVAEELGLEVTEEHTNAIEASRRGSMGAYVRDHEPKPLKRAPGGVLSAFVDFSGNREAARLIRGDAMVGSLGWWTACGLYLARRDQTADGRGASGLPAYASIRMLAGSTAFLSGLRSASVTGGYALGVLEATAREWVRRRRPGSQVPPPIEPDMADGATFLLAIGPSVTRNDLARLVALYRLDAAAGGAFRGDPEEDVPSLMEAVEALEALGEVLVEARGHLSDMNHDGSSVIGDLDRQRDEIARAIRSLDSIKG